MNLKVFHLKIVNSTNDFAIRKIKQGKKKGIVISKNILEEIKKLNVIK